LFAIGSLKGTKYTYITRLESVRCMRRKTTQNDIVLKAECEHVEGPVRFESVANQDLRFAVNLARSLVEGSKTFCIRSKLISEFM
jgi:hypothetical protein